MKTNIVLALIASLLIALNISLAPTGDNEPNPVLLSVFAGDIRSVSLSSSRGAFSLKRQGDSWTLECPAPFPADQQAAEALFSAIANWEAYRVLDQQEVKLASEGEAQGITLESTGRVWDLNGAILTIEYNVPDSVKQGQAKASPRDPGSVVPLNLQAMGKVTLEICGLSPAEQGCYAKVRGWDRLILLSTSQAGFIFAPVEGLRDRRLMKENAFSIYSVEISGGILKPGGVSVKALRTGHREWNIESPFKWVGDWKAIYSLCYRIEAYRTREFLAFPGQKEPEPVAGSPDLLFSYSFFDRDGKSHDAKIPFWKGPDGSLLCRSEATGAIVTVDPQLLQALEEDPQNLALRLAAPFNRHRVVTIGLTRGANGETILARNMDDFQWRNMGSTGEALTQDAPTIVDSGVLETFLRTLADLPVREIRTLQAQEQQQQQQGSQGETEAASSQVLKVSLSLQPGYGDNIILTFEAGAENLSDGGILVRNSGFVSSALIEEGQYQKLLASLKPLIP